MGLLRESGLAERDPHGDVLRSASAHWTRRAVSGGVEGVSPGDGAGAEGTGAQFEFDSVFFEGPKSGVCDGDVDGGVAV